MDTTAKEEFKSLYAHVVAVGATTNPYHVLVPISGDYLDKIRSGRKLNGEKEEDNSPIEFEGGEASDLIKVTSSVEMYSFASACVDSSIYLVGGAWLGDRPVSSAGAYESLLSITITPDGAKAELTNSECTMLCRRRNPFIAVSDGKIYVFGGNVNYMKERCYWGEVFDMELKKWSRFTDPPDAARCEANGCILWESKDGREKKIIVLILELELRPPHPPPRFGESKDRGRSIAVRTGRAQYMSYNLLSNQWEEGSFAPAKGLFVNYQVKYFLVAAGDFLFQVQGVRWVVYDLPKRKCIGRVQGLERIKDFPGVCMIEEGCNTMNAPKDVVYLGGRGSEEEEGGRIIELCLLWQGLSTVSDRETLFFAPVTVNYKVNGNNNKLIGTISSAAGCVRLGSHSFYEKCHAITGQPSEKQPTGGAAVECEMLDKKHDAF